jgi:cyclomaltodextrinase
LVDHRHIPHALAILLTCGGTPSIYAGDELAFRGIKEDRAGGDDAVRPTFPPTPAGLAPEGWPVYRLHQDLIGLRRRNAWLHGARTRTVHLTNQQMTYEVRDGENSLLVALSLADRPTTQPAPHAHYIAAGPATLNRPAQTDTTVQLAPHGWAVLTL